ncbi:hypothetical protein [Streptomyces sp. NPDC088755]|uniref:hypothetical protein n=1 Tax=Streptomyces sp. NPDC088755 TaxID=3365888 RepID=UPI00382FCCFB
MIDDDSVINDGGEPPELAQLRSPYSDRPVARARRAKAQELIERLVAEGRVRISEPDHDEVAEWRRVVNYAKRHGMEPGGRRIEKVPHGGPGLELFLADGPHPNAKSQRPRAAGEPIPVPARLGHLHPVVATLKSEESRLVMPPALRRRALLLLQRLAAEQYAEGTRCGRRGPLFTRARAEWTSLSTASRTPFPLGRSSQSPRIRSALPVLSWSSPVVSETGPVAGGIGRAGHLKKPLV